MKGGARRPEQDQQARARLRMIQHCELNSRNVCQTCRLFGISQTHFYMWLRRLRDAGLERSSRTGRPARRSVPAASRQRSRS